MNTKFEFFVFTLLLIIKVNSAIIKDDAGTLVLLDNLALRETHSIFFKSLQERGFKLTFKLADDSTLLLSKYGEYIYKNLIIFAPGVEEFGGNLSVEKLTEFVDDGGNVLIASNHQSGEVLREFASECGIEVDEEGATVIDHLNYDKSDVGDHTTILTSPGNLLNAPEIVGKKISNPLLYRGTGLITDKENELVLPLLTAESSAYSYNGDNPIKEYPHAVGRGTVLIAALQARNNARVVFSGSLYFFSDEAFRASLKNVRTEEYNAKSGNFAVSTAISKWVFGETGRLRVQSVSHYKDNEGEMPRYYTINDPVTYKICIEILENDLWKPFQATDVQLEFVRIDPFVRNTFKNFNAGCYEMKFQIPDVYGVYQFKVNYDRIGFTRLYNTTQVSVRPLEHTQYERFIPSAFPYYSSAISMMIGVYIFSFVFLHFQENPVKHKDEKKTM